MSKRLMTLTDLYNYYSTQGVNQKFSCEDSGDTIVVQVDGNLNFSNSESLDGLFPTRVQMNFIGDNLNGSRIKMNSQKAALPSSQFRPLLAFIHEVDGQPQFYGHNMHQDDDGNLIYDETPVGVISEQAHIEHDDEYDMDYAVANGYIWEEYSKAAEIIQRDQKCSVSVELSIRALSYDAQDKILNLDDFYYSGCTILGMDEEGKTVNPAMPGSNISFEDFSAKNNSMFNESKLIESLDNLTEMLSKFNINTSRKEEELVDKNEKMEVAEEIIEQGEVSEEVTETTEDDVVTEVESTEETEETPEEVVEEMSEVEEEIIAEQNSIEFSANINGETKTFSLSLNDKLNAMYSLVNESYGDLDGDYYDVNVFEDEGMVEMYGLFSGRAYRQNFKCKKNNYQLVGDRVEIFKRFLSEDEINALEKMKADFSVISEKLQKYEEEPKKVEVLESQKYGYVAGTIEFEELKNNHFDLSVDEVTSKANDILLQYAESGALKFSAEQPEQKVERKALLFSDKKTSRYGNLFSK